MFVDMSDYLFLCKCIVSLYDKTCAVNNVILNVNITESMLLCVHLSASL